MEPEEIEAREFLISLRGYDRAEVDEFLKKLADEIRHLRAEPAGSPSVAADGAAETYRKIGEETSKILLAAEEAGRGIRDVVRREAAEVLTDARREAAEITRSAQQSLAAAEEDLRKLREARSILATQLEDVRRRLDETIARLSAPGEAASKPKAPVPKAAPPPEAAAAAPERTLARPQAVEPKAGVPAAAEGAAREVAAAAEGAAREVAAAAEGAAREVAAAAEAPPPPVETAGDRLVREALSRRDQVLGDGPSGAARRLKRLLQEDQNGVLDRIRTQRGRGSFESDISSADAQLTLYCEGLFEVLGGAFRAGQRTAGASAEEDPTDSIRALVSKQLVNPLRRDLTRAVASAMEAKDTPTAIAERAGDVYRVWKGVRTELLGEGLVYAAFHQGLIDTWRAQKGMLKRWVQGPEEGSCPKGVCRSNAEAGAVAVDVAFPSGHLAPPAHGGCTCTLVGPGDGSAA